MIKKIFLLFNFLILFLAALPKLTVKGTTNENTTLPTCYQQNDIRWGGHLNNGATMASSACGILSTVNAINYLTGNFIDPIELADYAYSIDAYNGSIGGGTARYVFYNKLAPYENKYGFKVSNVSVDAGINDSRLKTHLMNKGVSIAYVPGHFIAIVEYNSANDSYLIYDSAANLTKRHTKNEGTWLSSHELSSELPAMEVKWFCLIERTSEKYTCLDMNETIFHNGYAEYNLSEKLDAKLFNVSGWAIDSRGLREVYYKIDTVRKNNLSFYKRSDIDLKYKLPNNSVYRNGFYGSIDLSNIESGTHDIDIVATTLDGGVSTLAKIKIMYQKNSHAIDMDKRTYTVSMDRCFGQKDVLSSWQAAGFNSYVFCAQYNSVINIGHFDLSHFSKAEIYYSTDASFDADKDGTQSIMGFKSKNCSFGYHGLPVNYDNSLVANNMENGKGWQNFNICTLNLDYIDYSGELFVSGYNQEGALYAIDKIVFYYKTDYTLSEEKTPINTNENLIIDDLNIDLHNQESSYLGFFNLDYYKFVAVTYETENANKDFIMALTSNKINSRWQEIYDTNNLIMLNENIDASGQILIDLSKINNISDVYLSIISKNDMMINIKKIVFYNKAIKDDYIIYEDDNCHKILANIDEEKSTYVNEEHDIITIYKEPTCSSDGMIKKYCSICNYVLEDKIIESTGHYSKDDYWFFDEGEETHYQICSDCFKKFNEEKHDYTSYGYNKIYHWLVCSKCGAKKDIEKHQIVIDEAVNPTCIQNGVTEGKHCEKCGMVIVNQEIVAATGHKYENGACIYCQEKDPNYVPADNPRMSCKRKKDTKQLVVLFSAMASLMYIYSKKH